MVVEVDRQKLTKQKLDLVYFGDPCEFLYRRLAIAAGVGGLGMEVP